MKKFTAAVMMGLIMSGCVQLPSGAYTDSLSTAIGINSGRGAEANPLLPSDAAGAAVTSLALKAGVLMAGRRYLSAEGCRQLKRNMSALSWGVSANNIAVASGSAGLMPMGIGLAVGMLVYKYANAKGCR